MVHVRKVFLKRQPYASESWTRIAEAELEKRIHFLEMRCHQRLKNTANPMFSDHIKQYIFLVFRQVVAYCFMKVVQKAHAISMSHEWMVV